MTLLSYIRENCAEFNFQLKTEEDLKIKVLIPYLESLGYAKKDMRFENRIDVQIGTRIASVKSDVEIQIDGKTQLIIDAKAPRYSLTPRDILQSASYGKLISTPPALYACTTNGRECVTTNLITGRQLDHIPTQPELRRDIDRTVRRALSEIELREIRSVLLTISRPDDLYKIINRSKEIIEKRGLIRTDQSFREMTKILLVKMNEERRVKDRGAQNRFNLEYLQTAARAHQAKEIDVFRELFEDAKRQYPAVYGNRDEKLIIEDNECIKSVCSLLEPWSFLGTGDDIKGAVYEIFLKSTLRGEFDQYFTPREIVDFIVKLADPSPGEVIIDPACGSGGFLIQAFRYVTQKITNSDLSDFNKRERITNLVEACLWGNEADYDLHVLAKINLIMHGDGYNHISLGDALQKELPLGHFDIALTNPPFTIKYEFPETLMNYELGIGKISEELDILFVERCIDLLKPGGNLFIILPEGLVNNRRYRYFREWLLRVAYLLAAVSLPEGTFIPFGKSVSKTCVLGVRKKGAEGAEGIRPRYVFLGVAKEIGFETGKKNYRPIPENDLSQFSELSGAIFDDIKMTDTGGECGWIDSTLVRDERIDASYLLNLIDREKLHERFEKLVPLGEVAWVRNVTVQPEASKPYYYLEVPDISPVTGLISNIRKVPGAEIKSEMHLFKAGDLLFTRINPRLSRVTIVPDEIAIGLVSKEVYNIVLKPGGPLLDKFVLCALLQSEHVRNQIVRLATGSSSSRARVHPDDLLENVFLPIPDDHIQRDLSSSMRSAHQAYWAAAQGILQSFTMTQLLLGSPIDKDGLRSV